MITGSFFEAAVEWLGKLDVLGKRQGCFSTQLVKAATPFKALSKAGKRRAGAGTEDLRSYVGWWVVERETSYSFRSFRASLCKFPLRPSNTNLVS